MAAMLQRRGEIPRCWLLNCWWSLFADLEMAVLFSMDPVLVYLTYFLTWSLTFLAPVFLTPTLKNLIASVCSYLHCFSSSNQVKDRGTGFESGRRWVDWYPCRSGRDGTNSRDSRSAPTAPSFDSSFADLSFPFFSSWTVLAAVNAGYSFFYGSLYLLQRIFY